jgi:hypothetical protein
MGIAVRDTTGDWCVTFRRTVRQPRNGDVVTLSFANDGKAPSLPATVAEVRSTQCHAAFAQPRWDDYLAYNVRLSDPSVDNGESFIGFAVLGSIRWAPGQNGAMLADLDGDGHPEQLRRCAADEGEHFTVWRSGSAAPATLLWHEYFDWGALVDRTCAPGDDGR